MPSTDGPESYSAPLFPGDILLIRDLNEVKLFDPMPPLCGIQRKQRLEAERPQTPFSHDGAWMVYLAAEPHEWLMERGWDYSITTCERQISVILELGDKDRALMFKLTWAGMETSDRV